MARQRVSLMDRDEALEICARIRARHPDILERRPDGLYRSLVAGNDMRQVLFDYLACDRVAAAWDRKRPAKAADLERLQQAGRCRYTRSRTGQRCSTGAPCRAR
jgi:hypothetical protein